VHFAKPKITFLKRAGTFKKFCLVFTDSTLFMSAILLGFWISDKIRLLLNFSSHSMPLLMTLRANLLFLGLPLVILIGICDYYGHYTRFKGFWDEFPEFIKAILIAVGYDILYLFIVKAHFSRLWLISTWSFIIFLLPTGRLLCKLLLIKLNKWFTPTLIIGSGQNAVKSAIAIESDTFQGFKVLALMALNNDIRTGKTKKIRNFLTGEEKEYPVISFNKKLLSQGFDKKSIPYIVLALEPEEYITHKNLVEQLAASRYNMSVIPPINGVPLIGSEISPIFRHDVLHVRIKNNLGRKIPQLIKRLFDIILSSILLFFFSPFFVIASILIKLDGGSVFYLHPRVGRNGKTFNCIKFRSMRMDADKILENLLESNEDYKKQWEKTRKLKNDPRVTPIGHFLRKTSLDELPQLLNVLKGEMSLVGPRPIVKSELAQYGNQAIFYLDCRPGMTGLWQISGRSDTDYTTRINLDAWYVRNWSLWYDITILFRTIQVVLNKTGAY